MLTKVERTKKRLTSCLQQRGSSVQERKNARAADKAVLLASVTALSCCYDDGQSIGIRPAPYHH